MMSCIKEHFSDESLTFYKTDYIGNKLKIDGYYLKKDETENYYYSFIFYCNGIAINLIVDSTLDDYIKSLHNSVMYQIKSYWGLYLIKNDTILTEHYQDEWIQGMKTYLKTGIIINDTTFIIKEEKRAINGSELKVLNDTFHFRKFSPKPDSTNQYIL